jgi:hypothetical protein
MKLKVSKKEDAIKESGGGDGSYINRSGVYDVNLNYVQVAETKNKAHQLNFNVTNQGMEQTIYGPILIGIDGTVNKITENLLNRLCILAGMDHDQLIETETVTMKVGKDKKDMEMEVIPELNDLSVKMRVQMEYSMYEGKLQERKGIKAFYREDGATASEAEDNENIGKRLAIDEEKYATNVTYRDGLTAESVSALIKERIDASAPGAGPSAKPAAKRPLFNK